MSRVNIYDIFKPLPTLLHFVLSVKCRMVFHFDSVSKSVCEFVYAGNNNENNKYKRIVNNPIKFYYIHQVK